MGNGALHIACCSLSPKESVLVDDVVCKRLTHHFRLQAHSMFAVCSRKADKVGELHALVYCQKDLGMNGGQL